MTAATAATTLASPATHRSVTPQQSRPPSTPPSSSASSDANDGAEDNRYKHHGQNHNNSGSKLVQVPCASTEFNKSLKPLQHALDPLICQKASRYAIRVYEEMSKRSTLLNEHDKVPEIERSETLPFIGELLGRGGFNSVYELNVPKDLSSLTPDSSLHSLFANSRQSNQQLAIKFLSDAAMAAPEEFCNGAADLLMEAKYLAALSSPSHTHPHLIRIHAVCAAGPHGFSTTGRAGYFIVIDRLYDTLDRRMDVWVELRRRLRQGPDHPRRERALYLQRLGVCVDIASALKHLHQLKLLFRDLKPDNVGFDHAGQVKLFDFGLAKGE